MEYQSEWVPRGITMRAFCDRNNVPYRVMDNFVRTIRKKIVEVEVTGRPEEGQHRELRRDVVQGEAVQQVHEEVHGRGRGEGYNDRRLHGVQLPRREAGCRPPDLHGARVREVQEGPRSGQGRIRHPVY